ncbi:conserved hypothetical protein [Echinococcus multilocularis]|uniref:Uncharacterized protein n=1 Tax=Echinococcus multilocularis TaxID=6211 RepID=A0A068XVN9_ECHMU|nr:conserved hypothetical protein [Echinococcus multilocularis]
MPTLIPLSKPKYFLFCLLLSPLQSNRGLYNNGRGGGGGGGGGVSQTPRMDGVESQSQQRLPPPSQSQSRRVEAKMATAGLLQTSAESGKPGLLSHISPLHASQTSPSPSAYQPNLVPISVSPHSPQFYTGSNTSPSRQHHLQFKQPPLLPPPPPSLGLVGAPSQQPPQEYTCQSAWGLPGNQDCGNGPVGNALNSASTAASMIGEMSLVEYRRTYSDSCIPNSFPDVSYHSRCFPPHQQYNRQQHQQPPPPPLLPLPLQRQQQRQQQRTLPPVDELALPRYQNTNSNTASNRPHTSFFNGGLLSSRCRHQSSTTVSQQPFRRLQSDYHSMRNIPQRYAPVHHHHHNPQQAGTPVQPLLVQTAGGGEGYASGPIAHPYQTWNTNGGNGGGSMSAYDLPSSSSALRLKRSDVYSEYRAKPPPLQLLPHVSQMPTTMGYENHSIRSVGSSCSSDGGGYFSASTVDPLAYHQPQSSCASSVLGSAAAATTASNNGVGSIAISSSASLTQPLDISVLDSDAFPSPEQEGRRDSFSMAVDLLSRLEKRSLDSSLAACTASPPLPPLPTTTTGTSLWSSSSACPPPSKSAKFDASATITDTAASTFFVPIAANDLQLLTEPSMANYVTDAATEDQLVREQYSPTQQSVLLVYFSPFLLLSVLCSTLCRAGPLAVGEMNVKDPRWWCWWYEKSKGMK